MESVPPRRTVSMHWLSAVSRSTPPFSMAVWAAASGSRPPTAGHLANRLGYVVVVAQVQHLGPVATRQLQPLGNEIDAYDPEAFMPGDAGAHQADGPEPEDRHAAALGHPGVLDGLPARRQDVREVHEPLVGHPGALLGDLYGYELRLWDPQVLRLAARHLAVELGVSEELGARAVLVHLGSLALRVEPLVAHKAVPAAYVEGQDDAVAGGDVRDLRPHLLDDPHRLVAEDVALVYKRAEHA